MKSGIVNLHTIKTCIPVRQKRAVSQAIEKVILDAWIAEASATDKDYLIFEARIDRLYPYAPTLLQRVIKRLCDVLWWVLLAVAVIEMGSLLDLVVRGLLGAPAP